MPRRSNCAALVQTTTEWELWLATACLIEFYVRCDDQIRRVLHGLAFQERIKVFNLLLEKCWSFQ
jgi:hypothetical protein